MRKAVLVAVMEKENVLVDVCETQLQLIKVRGKLFVSIFLAVFLISPLFYAFCGNRRLLLQACTAGRRVAWIDW